LLLWCLEKQSNAKGAVFALRWFCTSTITMVV
jgi:hypothetical protein